MKAKMIKKVLRAKIDEWISTIEDEGLRDLVKRDTIVTGGCIASMLLKERVNDYDVYFKTYETTLAVARYYLARFNPSKRKGIPCKIYLTDGNRQEIGESRTRLLEPATASDPSGRIKIVIKSAGIASDEGAERQYEYFEARPMNSDAAGAYVEEVMGSGEIEDQYEETQAEAEEVEDKTYRPVFMSTNAITLSNRIQIVIRFWGKPEEIHENYDFLHCTNYWLSKDDELVLKADALEALLTKELRYVGSRYPICSMIRVRKFVGRQWTINAGQILKMAMQISELDLRDVNVLEDQLTGVDAAYFCEVIAKMRAKDASVVNSAYLIEIIDRMF